VESITQLEKRLRELHARLEHLTDQLEQNEMQMNNLQTASRWGGRVRAGEVGKSRLRIMTLETSIATLEQEIEQVERDLAQARVWHGHEAQIARLVALVNEAHEARDAFYATLASVKLGAPTSELVRAYTHMKKVRSSFVKLAVQLAPGLVALKSTAAYGDPEAARRMAAELESLRFELESRGADLSAVCARFDSTMEETVWDENKVLPGL
jgi:DNA repair exonuclease SbcCD ATPase subunit